MDFSNSSSAELEKLCDTLTGVTRTHPRMTAWQEKIQRAQERPKISPSEEVYNLGWSTIASIRQEKTTDAAICTMVQRFPHETLTAMAAVIENSPNLFLELCEKERGNVVSHVIGALGGERCDALIALTVQHCVRLATHKSGCLALTRILDGARADQNAAISIALMHDFEPLVCHQFGNFVLSHIAQGTNEAAVFDYMCSQFECVDLMTTCLNNKFGSHVFEAYAKNCSAEHLFRICAVLFSDIDHVKRIATSKIANYPLQACLRQMMAHDTQHELSRWALATIPVLVQGTKFEKKINRALLPPQGPTLPSQPQIETSLLPPPDSSLTLQDNGAPETPFLQYLRANPSMLEKYRNDTSFLHPCIREVGHCKLGAACLFIRYPRDSCLPHLKTQATPWDSKKNKLRPHCINRHCVEWHVDWEGRNGPKALWGSHQPTSAGQPLADGWGGFSPQGQGNLEMANEFPKVSQVWSSACQYHDNVIADRVREHVTGEKHTAKLEASLIAAQVASSSTPTTAPPVENGGDGHDEDDWPSIPSTPPSIPNHGKHGPSSPIMDTNFVGAPIQRGTPSEDTPISVHGVVCKTTEAVVRTELNGRVPYLHFPPLEEMQRIVKAAKDALEALDQERVAADPDLPVTPDGRLRKSYMPVFFGQVPFSTTQHHLTWLLIHVSGLVPSAVSSHSPGCFTCYFANLDECNAVLSLNNRMLFDTDGVWAAQDPYQTDLVFTSANFWRQKQQQQRIDEKANDIITGEQVARLPRGAMVVELPVQAHQLAVHQ